MGREALSRRIISLLDSETLAPLWLCSLKTIQGLLEKKKTILQALDEEIIKSCPLTEVEQEMVESEDISELIIECIDWIKSVITDKTGDK